MSRTKIIFKDKIEVNNLNQKEIDYCDFAIWLQDNFSQNKVTGTKQFLPVVYWRRDFSTEILSIVDIIKEYKEKNL